MMKTEVTEVLVTFADGSTETLKPSPGTMGWMQLVNTRMRGADDKFIPVSQATVHMQVDDGSSDDGVTPSPDPESLPDDSEEAQNVDD